MKTSDFSYFIERFIAGEMDEAEKLWFTKEIEGNDELRHEVELRRKTDEILVDQDIMKLRLKLSSIEKKRVVPVRKNAIPGRLSNRFIYAVAATAVIVIALSPILFRGKTMSGSDIIERYYKPYEAISPTRSGTQTTIRDYNIALEYYKIRDFKQAAVYFSKVIKAEPENMGSNLLNGISNYEIKNYPEAEESFEKVIADENNYFIDHAQWYLALCYIQTDESNKAKEMLSTIKQSNTTYSKNARKILKSLK